MTTDIVPLMGLPADDGAVKALLASYGITKAPKSGSSVGSKEHGIELAFKNERQLTVRTREYEKPGALALYAVFFFGKLEPSIGREKIFAGALPHGLTFAMSPAQASKLLGKPSSEDGVLARWDFQDHCVFCRFNDAAGGLSSVTLQLPIVESKKHATIAKDVLAKASAPAPKAGALDWLAVYKTLGITPDFATLLVEPAEGYWDIYVTKGLTLDRMGKALQGMKWALFPRHLADGGFDEELPTNDRTPAKGSYRVRVASHVEGDPELANQAASALAKQKVKGITVLEWLLLDVAYFLATKKHINTKYAALCTGTRSKAGAVPALQWIKGPKEINIKTFGATFSHATLVARAVRS